MIIFFMLFYYCTCVDGGLSPVVKGAGLDEKQSGEISALKSQLGTKSKYARRIDGIYFKFFFIFKDVKEFAFMSA